MSYQVHRYGKSQRPTEQVIVLGFFRALWWVVSLPFRLLFGKKTKKNSYAEETLDRQFIENKKNEIDTLMRLGQPSNYSRAVLESDKLIDHILKGLRAPGLTMGDRLKASKNKFTPEGYDAAWRAHKVRNEIVHNSQYEITDFMAKEAVENFKKAMNELIN